jgi:hypothetical protein
MPTNIFNTVRILVHIRKTIQAISSDGRGTRGTGSCSRDRGPFSVNERASMTVTLPRACILPVLYRRTHRHTPTRRPSEARGPFGRLPAFGGMDSALAGIAT